MRRLVFLMPLLALIAACSDDTTGPSSDDPQPAPAYDLVFEGVAGNQTLLFRAPADGSGEAGLIGSGFAGTRPRVNPGARSLLFTAVIPATQTRGIMVHMLDQVAPFPLLDTQHEALDAVVSPDGSTLAFTFMQDDGLGDVFVADWDARGLVSNLRNLTPPPLPAVISDREPAWSPDGATIAFVSGRSGVSRIWLMAADGADPRELDTGDGTARSPAWSPDGQWIAFEFDADDSPNTRVGIVRPDGTGFTVLDRPGASRDPAWAPDGGSLAIASDQGGVSDIHVVSVTGDLLAAVTRPGRDANPAWIAHGAGR